MTDLLSNVDYLGDFLNTEDIAAALIAMSFSQKKTQMTMDSLYAFVGSMGGRLISKTQLGYTSGNTNVNALLETAKVQSDAVTSAVIQAALDSWFQRTRFLNAFEKAAATQVIGKFVGGKIAGWATVALNQK